MRFRFCGGLEPPDWLLAEIPLLATLDVARVTDACEKLSQEREEAQVAKALHGVYTNTQDAKAATTVLRFVLFQAAKYDVTDRELASELLQLGMTSETAQAIATVYDTERASMREHLSSRSFQFPTIEQLRWRVHGKESGESKPPRVEMRLQLDREAVVCEKELRAKPLGESLAFTMTEDKFLALYEELTQAHAMLQSLSR